MHANELDYRSATDALAPVLRNLPRKLIAIDGRPGVGKTTLGRFLAWRFNVTLLETDLYLVAGQGRMVYEPTDEIARVISKRLDRPRPIIVEGAAILRLLVTVDLQPDFVIYVLNKNAPESHGSLATDLEAYEAEFTPLSRANLTLQLDHDC